MRAERLAWAVLVAIAGVSSRAATARAAGDPFAWAPRADPMVERGRQAGARFGLLSLREITVEIDNVFAAANRQALALAEQRLADLPGVRGVFGPAGLLDITVDANGRPRARPVLARGQSEADGEAARQRVVRRADAVGWFLSENGRRARFYVDTDDWPRVAPRVTAALLASGLGLAPSSTESFESRPLWPDPRSGQFLPAALAVAWAFFVALALARARLPSARASGLVRALGALAVGVATAAPFALVPVGGIRIAGALAGLGAAVVVLVSRLRRPSEAARAPAARAGVAVARAGDGGGPSLGVILLALAIVGGAVALSPRLQVATRQWSASPVFFVSVRADMDEPVVLREVRRLADHLRAQPGVATAWSIADLFTGLTFEGEETSRIPDDADQVRRILVQARTDPAVGMELSGDHKEALVGVRFDDDPTVDHQGVVARLQRYIDREMRRSLLRADIDAPSTSPVTRGVGQGLLALDARERVLRICERSGRGLGPSEAQSVERVARQAATIPVADPGRLDAEISEAVRDFILRHPFPLPVAETRRLIAAIVTLGERLTIDEVRVALAAVYGARLPAPILRSTAINLTRRVLTVRRRLIARTNFRDMLTGAELPTEGVLADEVRGATAEAMGPIVGIPASPNAASTFKLDAIPIGGAANDRALSTAWGAALRPGIGWGAALVALVLALAGGRAGLRATPLAFAPCALALAPAAMLADPIGLPTLSFVAGTLAGGAVLATAALSTRVRRTAG